ncbi:MAG: hypothetical protein NUV75_04815 [Gallionella sp.]|nr:hypothetical protein [Gallionella sp.]
MPAAALEATFSRCVQPPKVRFGLRAAMKTALRMNECRHYINTVGVCRHLAGDISPVSPNWPLTFRQLQANIPEHTLSLRLILSLDNACCG